MNKHRIWYSTSHDFSSPDSIHQILMFGTIDEIQSLKKTVGEDTIKQVFLIYPKKIYTAPALNFIKNFVLHITSSIDEQRYLKNTLRHIR